MNRFLSVMLICVFCTFASSNDRFEFPWSSKDTVKKAVTEMHSSALEYLLSQILASSDNQKKSLDRIISDLKNGFLWILIDRSACIFFSYTDGNSFPSAFDTKDQQILDDLLNYCSRIKSILRPDLKKLQTHTVLYICDSEELAFAADCIGPSGETAEVSFEGKL